MQDGTQEGQGSESHVQDVEETVVASTDPIETGPPNNEKHSGNNTCPVCKDMKAVRLNFCYGLLGPGPGPALPVRDDLLVHRIIIVQEPHRDKHHAMDQHEYKGQVPKPDMDTERINRAPTHCSQEYAVPCDGDEEEE
jgi:hypothetical protein